MKATPHEILIQNPVEARLARDRAIYLLYVEMGSPKRGFPKLAEIASEKLGHPIDRKTAERAVKREIRLINEKAASSDQAGAA